MRAAAVLVVAGMAVASCGGSGPSEAEKRAELLASLDRQDLAVRNETALWRLVDGHCHDSMDAMGFYAAIRRDQSGGNPDWRLDDTVIDVMCHGRLAGWLKVRNS